MQLIAAAINRLHVAYMHIAQSQLQYSAFLFHVRSFSPSCESNELEVSIESTEVTTMRTNEISALSCMLFRRLLLFEVSVDVTSPIA